MKKQRILITGGTGYLGSNIVNNLKDKFDFVLVKRSTSNLGRITKSLPYLKVYDVENLNDTLLKQLDIDLILHCATHYGRKDSNPIDTVEANLMLPLKLLAMMKRINADIKFINTDTILDKNISEYSLSKGQFKEWMKFLSDESVYINVQLEHFYGPNDDKTKFVSFLINSFINEVSHLDLTAGEQYRYFTYIDDIVTAFETIINHIDHFDTGFSELQVSSDEPIQLKTFVCMVQQLARNTHTRLNFGALPYRQGEMMHFNVDCSDIRALGWKPTTTLDAGLLKTIEMDKQVL